jgi:membrane protein DedA with SNARE-associated domain
VLENLTDWATQAMQAGGSIVLALLMLVENLFPPIPSEVVLPFAGFLVARGELGVVQALVASTVGSVTGAVALYALGRWGGRPVLLRYRHVLRISEADLDRADEWFDRYNARLVLVARVVPIARSIVSVPAGASEMPLGSFLALTTIGSGVWNALLLSAGYLLGENWRRVEAFMSGYSRLVALVLAAGVVAALAWWWRTRARRRASSESSR